MVSGKTIVLTDKLGKQSIPSVVGFLQNGEILVGTRAVEQQETNPSNTIYDAKRFIGKSFKGRSNEIENDRKRYPFTIQIDGKGMAFFEVEQLGKIRRVSPEEIGSIIITYLRSIAHEQHGSDISEVVISVPAEFDAIQRNFTTNAVNLAKMGVKRIISEPTAAALAYGLHKKKGVEYIIVIDLGGGTLDVSVLWLNNAVFIAQAIAGNNHLGGQDFNERVRELILKKIQETTSEELINREDLQQLRLAIEEAKIQLTSLPETWIRLHFRQIGLFEYLLTRKDFEEVNSDLFESILEPVQAALDDCGLTPQDIDEIVLVGGSTRIPRIRRIIGTFFGKAPNYGVDPELAVVIGVAVQTGVVVNGWPLQVAAMEMPFTKQKKHIYKSQKIESGPIDNRS